MTSLMNEMISEAAKRIVGQSYAFVHRKTSAGKITLNAVEVNTNSKNNQFTKKWLLNGKAIAAAKLAAMKNPETE